MTIHLRKFNLIPIIAFKVIFLFFVVLSGCTHYERLTLQPNEILSLNSQYMDAEYHLGVGDVLSVKFFYDDKLNEDVTIRQDGKISLQLIGEISAAGLTPAQLEGLIGEKYSEALKSSNKSYVLGIGERIAVKFYYHDNLNEEVIIRPDGKISLQLIGEVTAAGLEPAQLKSILIEKYEKFIHSSNIEVIVRDIKMPKVTVIVKEQASQKIYVGGEVAQPKLIPINGKVRILDAVIMAGGELKTAELSNVILIRYADSAQPDIYSVDLKKIISGNSPDIILKPYDIVYLPRTAIAQVELFVKQYIYNLLPSQVMFSFPYNLNPEVQVEQK